MTNFSDNITSGNVTALTSALASRSGCRYYHWKRFVGNDTATKTGVFPVGTRNLDCKIWIKQQSVSAATAARFTVSAGGTNLIAVTGLGSAIGVLRNTQAGLGTITNTASATAILAGAATAELPYSVTYARASGDTTGDYDIELTFNREFDL